MKRTLKFAPLALLIGLALCPSRANAVIITKANNVDALNLTTSWVGAMVPVNGDIALWDSTVAAANTVALGASQEWDGIQVTNPGGAVTITNTATVLTLSPTTSTDGIDMSTATQNLTIGTSIVSSAAQTWNVNTGRTLNLWTVNTSKGLSGSGNVSIAGAGTVNMLPGVTGSVGFNDGTSNNTYSGNWDIGGTATVTNIRNGATAWGTGVINLSGGTLGQVQGNWTWTNNIALTTATTSTLNDFNASGTNRSLKLQGIISGSGNLIIADTSSRMDINNGFVLTGANTMSGTITLNSSGNLRVGGVTGNSTSLNAGTGGTLGTASVNISASNATLVFSRSDAHTVANAISGVGSVRVGGTSITGDETQVLTLSGTNTYTGATTVVAGELRVSGSTNTGAGTVTVGDTTAGKLVVNGTGVLTTTGQLSLGNGIATNVFAVDVGGDVNVGSINNAWGTDTTVDGTLDVTGGYTVATNATKIIAGSGTINAASFTTGNAGTVVNYSTNAMNLTGAMTLGGTTPTFNQTAGTVGTSNLKLDGTTSSTYSLTGGRINIGSGGVTGTAPTRNVNLGAGTVGASADWSSTLNMALTNLATGVTVNTLDSVDGVTARTITLSGILSGVGSLNKDAVGTLVVSGANTYAGTTDVDAGTLMANGTHTGGGLYTVASLGTLGGTGSTASDVTVNGTIAPGASIGTLGVGNTTINGTYLLETAAGSLSDLLNVTGALTLGGASILDLVGGSLVPSEIYTIANYTTLGGTFFSVDSNITATHTVDYVTGNQIRLVPVPEPGTFAMLLFGAICFWAVGRKRQ